MRICDALRDLVLFVQFKKREKHPWRSFNFSKVAGFGLKAKERCVGLNIKLKTHFYSLQIFWLYFITYRNTNTAEIFAVTRNFTGSGSRRALRHFVICSVSFVSIRSVLYYVI